MGGRGQTETDPLIRLCQSDSRERRRFSERRFGIYLRRCLQAQPANTKLASTEPPGDGEPLHLFQEKGSSSIPTPLLSIRWTQPGSCNQAEHPAVTPAFPSSRAARTRTHPSRETGTGSPRPQHCQAQFIPKPDGPNFRVSWRRFYVRVGSNWSQRPPL